MSTSVPKPPGILDKIVDIVLARKPKAAEARASKKRKKAAEKTKEISSQFSFRAD